MGDVYVKPGGGGGDLDAVTAVAGDVLNGKTIVDREGEPLSGTMPNRGAWTGSAGMNGRVAIPEGYHNGSGAVTGPSVTQRGAWGTTIGVNGSITIPEGYHNGGGRITQSIPTMGGQTVSPAASQQTISTSGKYMTGNVVVNGVSNLSAANIKKGVTVGGVTGTWEGYVSPIVFVNAAGLTSYSSAGVTSMLYSGHSSGSGTSGITTINTNPQVMVSSKSAIAPYPGLRWSGGVFNNAIVVTGYNYLSMVFKFEISKGGSTGNEYAVSVGLNSNPRAFSQDGANATVTAMGSGGAGDQTLTFNINNINGWQYLLVYAAGYHTYNTIYRITIKEIRFY